MRSAEQWVESRRSDVDGLSHFSADTIRAIQRDAIEAAIPVAQEASRSRWSNVRREIERSLRRLLPEPTE